MNVLRTTGFVVSPTTANHTIAGLIIAAPTGYAGRLTAASPNSAGHIAFPVLAALLPSKKYVKNARKPLKYLITG
ncbi:MAG TPA: hypothetical protein PKA28_05580 [Methylomusa anaerophila]|uniref:Uncharacterized protein n=1 Tax=Methylomusa anaerophila TaxID=1930071 RepID=A0A348ALY6_9FIRM|nr:hypothetical protein [Methylomusa anaerophila]BBB92084.1 hypothetical protein MAMMFC1_02769 [Methylomusa anaerophila]HML87903.1 hypothetical protein [Methylomusa anaerophila]